MLFSEAPEAARSATVIIGMPNCSQMSVHFTGAEGLKRSSWRTASATRSASALNPRRNGLSNFALLGLLREVAEGGIHDVLKSICLFVCNVFRAS